MTQNGDAHPLYRVRALLNELHDTQGLSWRDIAATGGFGGLSHATLQRVAEGHKPSAATCRALGVRKTEEYTLAFRFRDRETFERIRAAVDAHPGGRAEWLRERVAEVAPAASPADAT